MFTDLHNGGRMSLDEQQISLIISSNVVLSKDDWDGGSRYQSHLTYHHGDEFWGCHIMQDV